MNPVTNHTLSEKDVLIREHLSELLHGGFAPVVALLREYHYDKTSHMFDGLPFSTWSILGHMRWRQRNLLQFMQHPEADSELWPDPWWPEETAPRSESEWNKAIDDFENDLDEVIAVVNDPAVSLTKKRSNGKTLHWAAVAILQHNAYHIGQIKVIGRQLGVW